MILHDTEDGEVLAIVDYAETRRDSEGKTLGRKPEHLARMEYDRKQLESPVEPRLDESGNAIDGP